VSLASIGGIDSEEVDVNSYLFLDRLNQPLPVTTEKKCHPSYVQCPPAIDFHLIKRPSEELWTVVSMDNWLVEAKLPFLEYEELDDVEKYIRKRLKKKTLGAAAIAKAKGKPKARMCNLEYLIGVEPTRKRGDSIGWYFSMTKRALEKNMSSDRSDKLAELLAEGSKVILITRALAEDLQGSQCGKDSVFGGVPASSNRGKSALPPISTSLDSKAHIGTSVPNWSLSEIYTHAAASLPELSLPPGSGTSTLRTTQPNGETATPPTLEWALLIDIIPAMINDINGTTEILDRVEQAIVACATSCGASKPRRFRRTRKKKKGGGGDETTQDRQGGQESAETLAAPQSTNSLGRDAGHPKLSLEGIRDALDFIDCALDALTEFIGGDAVNMTKACGKVLNTVFQTCARNGDLKMFASLIREAANNVEDLQGRLYTAIEAVRATPDDIAGLSGRVGKVMIEAGLTFRTICENRAADAETNEIVEASISLEAAVARLEIAELAVRKLGMKNLSEWNPTRVHPVLSRSHASVREFWAYRFASSTTLAEILRELKATWYTCGLLDNVPWDSVAAVLADRLDPDRNGIVGVRQFCSWAGSHDLGNAMHACVANAMGLRSEDSLVSNEEKPRGQDQDDGGTWRGGLTARRLAGAFGLHVTRSGDDGDLSLEDLEVMQHELETLRAALQPTTFEKQIQRLEEVYIAGTKIDLLQKLLELFSRKDDEDQCILLQAPSGWGKSVVTTIASLSIGSSMLCGIYLFGRTTTRADEVVHSLAYQFASRMPNFRRWLLDAARRTNDFTSGDVAWKLDQMLIEPILRELGTDVREESRNRIFILDGMEEFQPYEERDKLLAAIRGHWKRLPSRFKLFVTTRPSPTVKEALRPLGLHEVRSLHDSDVKDGEICARSLLSSAVSMGLLPGTTFTKPYLAEFARKLADEAQGNLLCVDLAVQKECFDVGIPASGAARDQELGLSSPTSPTPPPDDPLTKLDELFCRAAANLFGPSGGARHRFLKRYVSALLAAEELPDSAILEQLLPGGSDSLRETGSLVETFFRGVWHKSFRDFLLDFGRSGKRFCIDLLPALTAISRWCLAVMQASLPKWSQRLCARWISLEDSASLVQDLLDDRVAMYASRHWMRHLERSSPDSWRELEMNVTRMLSVGEPFYAWLDLMVTLQRLDDAIAILDRLCTWLKGAASVSVNEKKAKAAARKASKSFADSTADSGMGQVTPTVIAQELLRMCQTFAELLKSFARPGVIYVVLAQLPVSSILRRMHGSLAPCQILSAELAQWPPRILTVAACEGEIVSVQFSPDGKSVTASCGDEVLRIYDATSGRPFATLQDDPGYANGGVTSFAYSPDGKFMVSTSWDGRARIWECSSGLPLAMAESFEPLTSVAFRGDGACFYTGSIDATVRAWDLSGNLLFAVAGHTDVVTCLTASPDSKILASGSSDAHVILWSNDGNMVSKLKGHRDFVQYIAFSPDSSLLLSCGGDHLVRLWSVQDRVCTQSVQLSRLSMWIGWNPQGTRILASQEHGYLELFDISLKKLATAKVHQEDANSAGWSPSGDLVVSCSVGGRFKIHRIADLLQIASATDAAYDDDEFEMLNITWAGTGATMCGEGRSDGVCVIASPTQGSVSLVPWSQGTDSNVLTKKPKIQATLRFLVAEEAVWFNCVKASPTGNLLAFAFRDDAIQVWTKNGDFLCTLSEPKDFKAIDMTFHPAHADPCIVVAVNAEGMLKSWEAGSGTLQSSSALGVKGAATAFAMSGDGALAVVVTSIGTAISWDLTQLKVIHEWECHDTMTTSVCVHPTGRIAITGSSSGEIAVWNLATAGDCLFRCDLLGDSVSCISFENAKPSGGNERSKKKNRKNGDDNRRSMRFAVAARDGSCVILEPTQDGSTFEPKRRLTHLSGVIALGFGTSTDHGDFLVTACNDRKVHRWKL
jgi:WD40 repeat protein